jgi:hypothetical protein
MESAEGRGMVGEKMASAKVIVVGLWVFSTLTSISGRLWNWVTTALPRGWIRKYSSAMP